MTITLAYHSVWKRALSASQKEYYEQLIDTYTLKEQTISIFPILVKQKKKGGIVATAFICNGFDKTLHIDQAFVNILKATNEVIASHLFSPNIHIPPYAAMPWSFVFSPEDVQCDDVPEKQWTIEVKPID